MKNDTQRDMHIRGGHAVDGVQKPLRALVTVGGGRQRIVVALQAEHRAFLLLQHLFLAGIRQLARVQVEHIRRGCLLYTSITYYLFGFGTQRKRSKGFLMLVLHYIISLACAWLLIYLAGLLQKNADVAYWDLLISFTVAYAVIAIIIAVSNHRGSVKNFIFICK